MITIIEGPDLSGKTTIANYITELTGCKVFHSGGPPKTKEECLKRLEEKHTVKIFDRHMAVSEQVYSKLPGRKQLVRDEHFDKWIYVNQPIILYCDPGLKYLLSVLDLLKIKPHKNLDHVKLVQKNYCMVYEFYANLMQKLSALTPVIKVDFTDFENCNFIYKPGDDR